MSSNRFTSSWFVKSCTIASFTLRKHQDQFKAPTRLTLAVNLLLMMITTLPKRKPQTTASFREAQAAFAILSLALRTVTMAVVLDTVPSSGRLSGAASTIHSGPGVVFTVSILGERLTCVHARTVSTTVAAFLVASIRGVRCAWPCAAVVWSTQVALRCTLVRDALLVPTVRSQEARGVRGGRDRGHVVAICADALGAGATVAVGAWYTRSAPRRAMMCVVTLRAWRSLTGAARSLGKRFGGRILICGIRRGGAAATGRVGIEYSC